MFKTIKNLFKKKRRLFHVLFGMAKKMSYPELTQKKIDEINTNLKYKGWIVTLKKRRELILSSFSSIEKFFLDLFPYLYHLGYSFYS